MLYRHFGDKEGLLSAVVDYGFEQYLESKRRARPSEDPVQDIRDGWDNHVRFATENPNFYRLMYSPALSAPPEAAAEAHRLLLGILERCAEAGRLRVSPETAARMVMSANTGVALSIISRPALYKDGSVSTRVRDAVVDAVVVAESAGALSRTVTGNDAVAATAATLAAQLRGAPPDRMTPAEAALLQQWLTRLADTGPHRRDPPGV
ncbi:TetR family transcriptional regulator [Streptomyces camponoticapitis]|uniref:TetR family transcriptional regulator n=2 Tax=Streptomyces camponoticapitis TaxID=1616125 RepID=A0ABQ2DYT4_9ACTN|nr:TetR family transcriptional regulator [Streptomyces camponoticapitis]